MIKSKILRGHDLRITIGTLLIYLALGGASAAETTLLSDNFESYTIGTFPTTGGWEPHYNALSDPGNNIITDTQS